MNIVTALSSLARNSAHDPEPSIWSRETVREMEEKFFAGQDDYQGEWTPAFVRPFAQWLDMKCRQRSAAIQRLTTERDAYAKLLHDARETFLCMIADAPRFEEDIDGDERDGRLVSTCHYHLTVTSEQLADLLDVLNIDRRHDETPGDAIGRALGADPVPFAITRENADPLPDPELDAQLAAVRGAMEE